MKRFTDFNTKNLTGGAPFANENFYTVQQEIYKAIARLAGNATEGLQFSGSSSPNCIIEGVEYSGSAGNYALSAGLVRLGDDIYEFDGAAGLSAPTRIEVGVSVDEQRQYKSGATKDFFETRKATLNPLAGAPFIQIDFNDQINTNRLGNRDKLDERIQNLGIAGGISTDRILGRDTAGSGAIEQLTFANVRTLINALEDLMSTDRLLGRTSGGSGVIEELTPANARGLLEFDDNLSWTSVTLLNGFTGTLEYAVDLHGTVHWRSDGLDETSATSTVFAAIPVAVQPPAGTSLSLVHIHRVGPSLAICRIFESTNQWIIQNLDGAGAGDGDIADFYFVYRLETI